MSGIIRDLEFLDFLTFGDVGDSKLRDDSSVHGINQVGGIKS